MKILLGFILMIFISAASAEISVCTYLDSKEQSQLEILPNTTNKVVREYAEKRNMEYEFEMRAKKNLVVEADEIAWVEAEKMIRMGMVFRVLIGDKHVILFSTSGHRYETMEPKSGTAAQTIREIDPCHNWIGIILT